MPATRARSVLGQLHALGLYWASYTGLSLNRWSQYRHRSASDEFRRTVLAVAQHHTHPTRHGTPTRQASVPARWQRGKNHATRRQSSWGSDGVSSATHTWACRPSPPPGAGLYAAHRQWRGYLASVGRRRWQPGATGSRTYTRRRQRSSRQAGSVILYGTYG